MAMLAIGQWSACLIVIERAKSRSLESLHSELQFVCAFDKALQEA